MISPSSHKQDKYRVVLFFFFFFFFSQHKIHVSTDPAQVINVTQSVVQ